MNQYGYIPLANAPLLQQHYAVARPSTWVIERWEGGPDPVLYGGVEEIQFTDAQKAEISALGGAWFPSAAAFTAWLNQYAL